MTKIVALAALFLCGLHTRAEADLILDTLGTAAPVTQFRGADNDGVSILPTQFVGPQFSLTQPTVLTEIGGFLNHATGASPFTVRIHRSNDGVPDPQAVLTSWPLSDDSDPPIVSYETVAPDFVLEPGTYFALFSLPDGSEGYLLGGGSDPFPYRAGLATLGCMGVSCRNQAAFEGFAAVRILGKPVLSVPEPALPEESSPSRSGSR